MITAPAWIRRALLDWQEWRARQQSQARFDRMMRADPALRRAAMAHDRHLKAHRPSRADSLAMRDAVHARLRLEVRHG